MRLTVDISLYPMTPEYGNLILDFVQSLREKRDNLTISTNPMSTQISGDYDQIMALLSNEIKQVFGQQETAVVVLKLTNAYRE